MPREDGRSSQIAAALPAFAAHRVGAFTVEIWCGGVDESTLWTCRSDVCTWVQSRGRRGECGVPELWRAQTPIRSTGEAWRDRESVEGAADRLFVAFISLWIEGGEGRRKTTERESGRTGTTTDGERREPQEESDAERVEATRRQCAGARLI